ncbi:uncharacterized protein [Rhodnius prolixus]|uniref:uncharacterized protein n=1 Tax=Rhodnius prolixus TaxID=13249 RepID=UPI003D187BD0
MVLKVVQANLHHAKAASAIVYKRFDRMGLDIALLQEPWCHEGIVRGLNPKLGKALYSKSAIRPRACVVLRDGIGCTLIPELCSGDFVKAVLNINTEGGPRRLIVCTANFPGDEDCLPSLLGDIVAHCRKEGYWSATPTHTTLLGEAPTTTPEVTGCALSRKQLRIFNFEDARKNRKCLLEV